MEISVSLLGAIVALVIAIGLILVKVPPVYGMMAGAFIGSIIGGVNLQDTVGLMLSGSQGMVTAVMRIIAAGILAGVLIETGAATVIAETLVKSIGETWSLLALAVAALILTAVGVFIDVAVITVAPIALAIAKRANLSRMSILLAMIGGGKAGNLMSPNPNAIAASEAFDIPLTSLMVAGIIPAIFGLIITYLLATSLKNKGTEVTTEDIIESKEVNLPSFLAALSGPIVAILLLSLRPIADISIDPMIALPIGGLVGAIFMGKIKNINNYIVVGLNKMSGVAIMLLGTGTLAGVISNSELKNAITNFLTASGLPPVLLAPISGSLMSLATASTTAGTSVASTVFGPTILGLGVSSIAAAAMIHAGATVLDHMPHGSFFHATGGSVNMDMKERLKLISYETLIGFIMTVVSTVIYGFIVK